MSGITRIALIGSGYMAEEHIRAIQSLDGVEVVSISSRNTKTAAALAKRYGIYQVNSSVTESYNEYHADGAVISVPELALPSVLEEATRFPWPLLVEKPVGIDLAAATALDELVTQRGRSVFVALNRRHFASTRSVLQNLDDDGHTRFVQVLDQENELAARESGQPEEVIRNWMFANSIHIIDLIRLFCRGEVSQVSSELIWQLDECRAVNANISFDSGDRATYQGVWNVPGPWSCVVTEGKSRWEMRPLESLSLLENGSRTPIAYDLGQIDVDFKPGLAVQAEQFINLIRGLQSTLPSVHDALQSMKLIESIYHDL